MWLRQISFSLYLVHAPVLVASMVLLHGILPLWAGLVVGIPASPAAAEVMRRLVEVPSRDLARWAERRLSVPRAEAAAAP